MYKKVDKAHIFATKFDINGLLIDNNDVAVQLRGNSCLYLD